MAQRKSDRAADSGDAPAGNAKGDGADGNELLEQLEGFWADVAQPKRQYHVRGEWCTVWRNGGPSNQRHHLIAEDGEIYWGLTRNFILYWQEDDIVQWKGSIDGKQKFAWRRLDDDAPTSSNTAATAAWKPKSSGGAYQEVDKGKGKTKGKGIGKGKSKAWSWASDDAWATPASWWSGGKGEDYGAWNAVVSWREPVVNYSWNGGWDKGWYGDDWSAGYDNWGDYSSGHGDAAWWQDNQDAPSVPKGTGDKGKGKAGKDSKGKADKGKGKEEVGGDEGVLLEAVLRAVGKDGLTLNFLSNKFSKAFDKFRGGNAGRDASAFRQWLETTGRFTFKQDSEQENVVLVTAKWC